MKTAVTKTPAPKHSNNKRTGNRPEAKPAAKPKKRENTFSQSRDTRESRGTRQVKTSQAPQTTAHMR